MNSGEQNRIEFEVAFEVSNCNKNLKMLTAVENVVTTSRKQRETIAEKHAVQRAMLFSPLIHEKED